DESSVDDIQRQGSVAGGLLPEEQGGNSTAEVWAGSPCGVSPGFRCNGSDGPEQGEDTAELSLLSSATRFGAAGSADQRPGEQHGVLRHLPQEQAQHEGNSPAREIGIQGWKSAMYSFLYNSIRFRRELGFLVLLSACALVPAGAHAAKKKKKVETPPAAEMGPRKYTFDPTKLVWPSPPNIGRVKWVSYFAGAKIDYSQATKAKPKSSWMDRLAGGQSEEEKVSPKNFPYQMIGPYGIAIDSKGLVYVADQRVGAVFIFNTETQDTQMIRNGFEAHFGWINGLAVDDDDRLFVSDGKMHRVLIFNAKHDVENQIAEGLQDPVGLAIDTTNRFLY